MSWRLFLIAEYGDGRLPILVGVGDEASRTRASAEATEIATRTNINTLHAPRMGMELDPSIGWFDAGDDQGVGIVGGGDQCVDGNRSWLHQLCLSCRILEFCMVL